MTDIARSLSATPRVVLGLLAAAIVLPVLLFCGMALQSRDRALDAAAESARQIAALLHEHALKVLQTHDLVLRQADSAIAGRDWDAVAEDGALARTLSTAAERSDPIRGVWLADAAGTIRLASRALPHAIDISDRDYFTAQHDADVGLFLGRPVIGRLNDRPVFAASRRRSTPTGAFDGVVAVTVDPRYFEAFWQQVARDLDPGVTLIRADGTVLASHRRGPHPAPASPETPRLGANSPMMSAIKRVDATTETWTSSIDGSQRIASVRKLGPYPAYIGYSVSRAAVLDRWWSDTLVQGAFALPALAILCVLGLINARQALTLATANRQAQAAHGRLNDILESTSEGVVVVDRAWRFTYLNPRAAAMLGRGRDLLGASLWDAFPEPDGGPFHLAFGPAMTERASTRLQTLHPPSRAWLDIHAHPSGEGIAVFFRDVTAVREASERERERERWHHGILDALPVAVYTTDADGRITFFNRAAVDLAGRRPVLGDDQWCVTWRLFTADGVPLAHDACPMAVALRENRPVRGVEAIAERPDGTRVPFIPYPTPLHDPSGTMIGAVNTLVDITDRKRHENRLKRSEAHLARAQHVAAIGSFEYDLGTRTLRWSDETYRIHGVEPAAFAPTLEAVRPLIHPEDRETTPGLAALADHAQARPPRDPVVDGLACDARIVRPDGAVRVLHREAEFVRDAAGVIVSVVGTLQDVTAQRQAEARRRELEQQLRHSQRLEAMGTLAGGIAHDLNNTLVPVLALSELLQEDLPAESRAQADLRIIQNAAIHARELVKQILAFSRREMPEKQSVDLARLVPEVVSMQRSGIAAGIPVEWSCADSVTVMADPAQIQQVLVNLCTNAAQAIGTGGGGIAIACDETSEGVVRIVVEDTGPGMDATTRERVFEPFFTTRPAGEGTGLGLAVVHGIVASHGGRITVASTPGIGTRFAIELPSAAKAEAMRAAAHENAAEHEIKEPLAA